MLTIQDLEKWTSKIPNTENAKLAVGPGWVPTDISTVCLYLNKHPEIISIELLDKSLGDEGAIALSLCDFLTEINVAWCKIGPEGAAALAKMPNLKKLIISRNPIGDAGAIALSHSKLDLLLVIGCNIGTPGAQALANGHNFNELEITTNPIGDMGVAAFLKNKDNRAFAGRIVSEVQKYDLDGWHMSEKGKNYFLAIRQDHKAWAMNSAWGISSDSINRFEARQHWDSKAQPGNNTLTQQDIDHIRGERIYSSNQ